MRWWFNGGLTNKNGDFNGINGIYPLVNIQKTMENHHRNNGFSMKNGWIFP